MQVALNSHRLIFSVIELRKFFSRPKSCLLTDSEKNKSIVFTVGISGFTLMRNFWSIFCNCMPLLTLTTAIGTGPNLCLNRHSLQISNGLKSEFSSSLSFDGRAMSHEQSCWRTLPEPPCPCWGGIPLLNKLVDAVLRHIYDSSFSNTHRSLPDSF